jgi:hypothetical protein
VGALAAVAAGAGGCATEPPRDPQPVQEPRAEPIAPSLPVADAYRAHRDARAGCRFPVPVSGVRITARHFDPSGPTHQIRHQLTLSLRDSQAVRIDLWDDPQRRPVGLWLDQHLSFLLDESSSATTVRLTAWDLEGLILEQPGSPQAHPTTTALVAAGGRVYRITCLRAHEPRALALFERIVAELEPEGAL